VLSSIPSKSNIVILDACRNNPYSAINKTSGRGLAKVDAPKGTLVSYSTAPGTEALDGDTNSPFTTALLQIGQEPGLPIEMALKRVRLAVTKATDPQQVPYESSSLTTEFSFFPTQSEQERPILVKAEQSSTKAGRPRETEIHGPRSDRLTPGAMTCGRRPPARPTSSSSARTSPRRIRLISPSTRPSR